MIDCVYATPTDKKWFDDLDPEGKTKKNFACRCMIVECRNPERIPPKRPPLDAAGIHSHVRYNSDGSLKTDFILVRSKYCGSDLCKDYERSGKDEGYRLRDLQG